jgi:predicted DNA-binding transcriptional regulator YafY
MANVRLARLLRLLTLLRARSARTPKAIARELDVSERTVYRDLNALELAGVPYRFDITDGGYRIDGDFFLPPLQFTLGEAMALSVLAQQLAGRGQIPFIEDAWRAAIKVRSQLPAAIREEVAMAEGHVRIESAPVSPQRGCEPHFETLRRAITAKRKIRCTYDGGSARHRVPFLFRPYALFFGLRAWYVIGYSEAADGERSLKLNRLSSVKPTERPYMIPGGWTLERSLGHAWRMIRGERRYHVKVCFDREFGRTVADTLWHTTQRITWSPDGHGCVFECEVDGLDEILWWVLGYGPHARVLAPPELVSSVTQAVDGLCRIYCSPGTSPMSVKRRAGPIPLLKTR